MPSPERSLPLIEGDPEQTIHQALAQRGGNPAMNCRRFPPPWVAEEQEAYFIVSDANERSWLKKTSFCPQMTKHGCSLTGVPVRPN